MKRYFAGQSAHGSETSHGFANDWDVFVFDSKQSRDLFVSESKNLSTVSVLAKDATSRAANYSLTDNKENRPEPFSGEFWGVSDTYMLENNISGCIGQLVVCDQYDRAERFNLLT